MKAIINLYAPVFCKALVYMMQSTEYRVVPFLAWFWQTKDFGSVMYRRTLDETRAATALLLFVGGGMYGQMLLGASVVAVGVNESLSELVFFGLAIVFIAPILWAHILALAVATARLLLIGPQERHRLKEMSVLFEHHQAVKIAVAGSYGKTTMKELLATVLGEGKRVAATPANKNVPSSHLAFARSLDGDEDILIIEYGEGKPGDVDRFARYTHPTHAVITGIAPAHLDQYKTVDAAAKDIFSVADYVKHEHVFVNAESHEAEAHSKPAYAAYDRDGALGWKVSKVDLTVHGMSFVLSKGRQKLQLKTGLVGEHLIGPIAFAAALAHELGLTNEQIIRGVASAKPHPHRMQPYALNGAWIIDDTYNGNLEGIRAGSELLAKLPAKRKLYVTPGLVDQGAEAERVHQEIGRLIAGAEPDKVVLMKNSVTQYIKQGLEEGDFGGELVVEERPLEFYANLVQFVAAGDLVLMQNDWTDNYQ